MGARAPWLFSSGPCWGVVRAARVPRARSFLRAFPPARCHPSLPSLSGRSALRGVGVAPEFKRTAAVGGEVTACFEPSRLAPSAAGSGLDLAAQAAFARGRWRSLAGPVAGAALGTPSGAAERTLGAQIYAGEKRKALRLLFVQPACPAGLQKATLSRARHPKACLGTQPGPASPTPTPTPHPRYQPLVTVILWQS